MEQMITSQEIELEGDKYLAYLKRVATKLENGQVASTTVRAFIKKI